MADPQLINFYLIDTITQWGRHTGADVWKFWGKVVFHLRTYMGEVTAKVPKAVTSVEIWWCPEYWNPSPQGVDIVIYVVTDVNKSVIKHNGGDVTIATGDTNILGLTDLNLNICEVYFDRVFQGSTKEVAGAAYHEAAHVKSRLDNAMHTGRDGFLGAKPDYNGNPTTKNTDFVAKNITKTISQKWVPFSKA
jgi:hypothetical protein